MTSSVLWPQRAATTVKIATFFVALLALSSALHAADNQPDQETDSALAIAATKQVNDSVSAQAAAEAAITAELPQAVSVDLGEPVADLESATTVLVPEENAADEPKPKKQIDAPALIMLGAKVPPRTSTRLSWSPAQSFEGLASPTPVLVVHGKRPGPTLCLTAAVHGDEINGIEIVRRILYNIDPDKLSGSVIGVPIVNLQGFQRNSRYLPDRRDLNRYFPGAADGSSAARIAHSFFNEVIVHCSVLVDIHTGSFDRTNLSQLRADLSNSAVEELTQGFGATVVLHNSGAVGTLRRAAVEHGIPAVTIEAGGPMRFQEKEVAHSVKSIHTLLNHLGMVKKSRVWGDKEQVYYSSRWLRADKGGILLSEIELGKEVEEGDLLGTITNPITNVRTEMYSPIVGRIIGMTLDQVVLPGYAAYHIGITAENTEARLDAESAILNFPQDPLPESGKPGQSLNPITLGAESASQPVDEPDEFD